MKTKLTTLCYIEEGEKYLMLHRVSKEKDINKDKWIGVGGHFEGEESPEECLLREVYEETGLTLTSYQFRGIVTFCSEGNPAEYMCLYTADGFEGELKECDEGNLEWVEKDKLEELNLWDGDVLFLDLLQRDVPFFSLKLCYRENGFWYRALLNGRELELLDLVNKDGTPTGHVRERSMVHKKGELHRTVHIWVVSKRMDGSVEVLLQRRSQKKDAYPGCYDVSAAGHMFAGEDFEAAACRELLEELGIDAQEGELRFIGFHEGRVDDTFWEQSFKDWEISAVYLYERPVKADSLIIQKSEVEEVGFWDYDKVLAGILEGTLKTCIYPEEFKLIKKALEPGFSAEGVRVVDCPRTRT